MDAFVDILYTGIIYIRVNWHVDVLSIIKLNNSMGKMKPSYANNQYNFNGGYKLQHLIIDECWGISEILIYSCRNQTIAWPMSPFS